MKLGHTLRETYSKVRHDADSTQIHLEQNELYDILADSRRRMSIDRLTDRDVETCADLAADIAASETHMPKDRVPKRRIESVVEDLRDEHLPRLAEAGVLKWDEGDEEIRPGHSIEGIASLLREVDRRVNGVAQSERMTDAADISTPNWSARRRSSNGDFNH